MRESILRFLRTGSAANSFKRAFQK